MKSYKEFINEAIKYLSSPELFEWLEKRRDYTFIALDTETTGLRGPKSEQLTQIAAVAYKFQFEDLRFVEIGKYNEKIKLNKDILAQKELPDSRIKSVFKYTRYGVSGGKFVDEQTALNNLLTFVNDYDKVILLIQNAPFDMPMINVRKKFGGLDREIFDTKDFYAYFLLPTLQGLGDAGDEEALNILNIIGRSSSGKLPTASLPKVAAGLGIDPNNAHDALFDCRYMVRVLEISLDIVQSNMYLNRNRYIKAKNKKERR